MRKALAIMAILACGGGCSFSYSSHTPADTVFDRGVDAVGRADAIVLKTFGGGKVVVSPRLQARVMNTRVGEIGEVGWISYKEIAEGETHEGFNNFGGQDRFWLGPEAGNFGIYFAPGAAFERAVWKVPPDFDKGAYAVAEKQDDRVVFTRDMAVTNYAGTAFRVRVRREVGILPETQLAERTKINVGAGVSYTGSYSDNTLTNTGAERWQKDKGLLNIWILGQFVPGPKAVVIAPFKAGDGPAYRDEPYFGRIPADRLKTVGNALLLRVDALAEGKIGIPQARTTGVAGSFDFAKNLLVVIRFDVPSKPELYGDSTWVKNQANPYGGDLFQAYNSNRMSSPDRRTAFYEMESVSPSRELAPGESVRHRHETLCFQGDYEQLRQIARSALGVDLEEVRRAMF